MSKKTEGGAIGGIGLCSLSIYQILFEGTVIGYAIQHQVGQGWSLYRMNGESGDLEYITATAGLDEAEIVATTLENREMRDT